MNPRRIPRQALLWLVVLLGTALSLAIPLSSAAAPRAAASVVQADSFGPAYITAGVPTVAVLNVHASAPTAVARLTVAVRDKANDNLDFPGAVNGITVGTSTYTYTSQARVFAAGTYTEFGSWEDTSGTWHPFTSVTLTVGAAVTGPPASASPSPTPSVSPTPTPSSSPTPTPTPTATGTASPTGPEGVPGNWTLAFDDEFNGTSVASTWQKGWLTDSEFSGPVNSAEYQGYDSANVTESGGSLNLALQNGHGALVNSSATENYTYGVAEARIYLPGTGSAVDNWPAWWGDGQSWPTDGEDDIVEGLSGATACHYVSSSDNALSGGCSNTGPGWHVYSSDWEPGQITFYYDGVDVGQVVGGIASAPQYLIFDNTSGTYGGTTVSGDVMRVDYVRVWAHS